MRLPSSSSRTKRAAPPVRHRSTAVYCPPGLRSAITGVAAATASISSSESGTSASRAIAKRCKTALVDPPDAAAAATALASEARVMNVRAP